MSKISRIIAFFKARPELALLLLAFLFYFFTLARDLNDFDAINFVTSLLKLFNGDAADYFKANQFVRNPLYLAIITPLSYVLLKAGLSLEFILNFSALVPPAIASIFIYKIGCIFFRKKYAVLTSLIFIFTPAVWFNATNSDVHSMQLLFVSVWLYYLLIGIKLKSTKHGYISSFFFMIASLTHLSTVPLIVGHIYGLLKISQKIKWFALNGLLLPPLAILSYVFSVATYGYNLSFSINKLLFSAVFSIWEFVHGLNIIFFSLSAISVFYLLRKKPKDSADKLLVILLFFSLAGLSAFNYIMIDNLNVLFVFLPIIAMAYTSRHSKKTVYIVFALIIIFSLAKIYPIYYQLHNFDHPHRQYAEWAYDLLPPDSVLFVGSHESPWYRYDSYVNNRTAQFFYNTETPLGEMNLTGKKIYVSSQYFTNENLEEFAYAFRTLNISAFKNIGDELIKHNQFENKTLVEVARFTRERRSLETFYEAFYSFYPNPILNTVTSTGFLKIDYYIYEVK